MAKPVEKKESTARNLFFQRRSLFVMLLTLITFALLLFWALFNFSYIWTVIKKAVSVFLPILYGFIIAFILNIFMRPLENLWDKIFSKRKINFKIKRAVCLTTSIILVVAIIFAVLFLILPTVTQTVYSLIDILPRYLDFLGDKFNEVKSQLKDFDMYLSKLNENADDAKYHIGKFLPEFSFGFLNTTFAITTSVFSGIVNFAIAFVFAIYMLAEKEKLCLHMKRLLYSLCPVSVSDKIVSVLDLINKTFSKFAVGQFTEALILGVLCFIGMKLFGFPYALAISALIAATALIPIVGAWIGLIIGAILILLTDPIKALWFVVFVIILQQIEGNIIYPRVVGKSIGLPGILVLAAITVGGNAYGIAGMLLGVPIVSVLYILLRQFINRRLKEKNLKIE